MGMVQYRKNKINTSQAQDALPRVPSSRSEDVAQEFINTVQAPSYCQAYGSQSDLINCPIIDVIYIATPHSHRFQNAMLALEAGKHVLFSVEVRRLLQAGAIGTVIHVFTDNGLRADLYRDLATDDRMVVKELAGGALLDRIDETTIILMKFAPSTADGPEIQATASVSLRTTTNTVGETAAVRIQGDQGEIQIFGWPWCPSRLRAINRSPGMNSRGSRDALAREPDSHGDYGHSASGERPPIPRGDRDIGVSCSATS
ncbi:hypothetical protein BDV38DRAFT_276226 [Aspergillus pseudotamarii]|uniref:D-xylose 1-dehydrogenase (NADP(+), D-xylono-1,5-lactone-forming) n=1 Tax=Aspergillus pseudotamarii TaxID=132259 RepID=A0A5N6SDD1_ASPPS|nr:uncharacterized protein BDV38DRAFT_276226 [Aspergillus pseudotamarii]KAE8131114.1 hypothetical protein BDV38DRAFT_276226 [Aspergillus pseudotamarii]